MAFPYPYVGPIALYNNLPIESQNYQPSRFVISDISLGINTTITTSIDHSYVVGQQIKISIPSIYGAPQLNNQIGIVLSIPASNQILVNINSSVGVNDYIAFTPIANITAATKSNPCAITGINFFRSGNYVLIQNVGGMIQLNNNIYQILFCNSGGFTINVNSSLFSNYTGGGIATLTQYDTNEPQVIANGDINSGVGNNTGRVLNGTFIPGSFINISA